MTSMMPMSPIAPIAPIAPTSVVIASAPGGMLAPLLDDCRALGPTELWAPLAAPRWLAHAPGALGRFAARRRVSPQRGSVRTMPPLLAIDGALRAWAGDATDRNYLAEFARRAAIDVWAATEIRRRRPRVVVASSLTARRTFAAARAIGARTVLVLDIPLLRALHRDLDRAAAVWPERRFLQRFRAPSWAIARQEAERVLADLVLVRGAYAHALCVADGIPEARLARLPEPGAPSSASRTTTSATGRLRLAGLAAARHGVDPALAAARQLGMTLVVRIGDGSEPCDLASQPGVATDDGPVDAIICPAICESYPPELRTSAIPVIASPFASTDGGGPDPYDSGAFARAIAAALTTVPHALPPIASLQPRLAALA